MKISHHIQDLLDIVFGRVHPGEVYENETLPLERADEGTLKFMERLVKVEFKASFEKEIDNNDEGTEKQARPNPFDVFLVEPTFRNRNITIAAAIPVTRGKDPVLNWLDENGTCWECKENAPREIVPRRKVTSLSGSARVLENLRIKPVPRLMVEAMNRTNLFEVSSLTSDTGISQHNEDLNQSQQTAVSALKSKTFRNSFFVIQGPPGTGKSTTLVDMICSANEPVIASAPSNAATANIALKLFETSRFQILQILSSV